MRASELASDRRRLTHGRQSSGGHDGRFLNSLGTQRTTSRPVSRFGGFSRVRNHHSCRAGITDASGLLCFHLSGDGLSIHGCRSTLLVAVRLETEGNASARKSSAKFLQENEENLRIRVGTDDESLKNPPAISHFWGADHVCNFFSLHVIHVVS